MQVGRRRRRKQGAVNSNGPLAFLPEPNQPLEIREEAALPESRASDAAMDQHVAVDVAETAELFRVREGATGSTLAEPTQSHAASTCASDASVFDKADWHSIPLGTGCGML